MVGTFASIRATRFFIDKRLEKILSLPFSKRKVELAKLDRFIRKEFGKMYLPVKSGVINTYNKAGLENKYLIEQTIGRKVKWRKPKIYKQIPQTKAFKITNKYLSDAAIVKRNAVNSQKLTRIIERNAKKGIGYDKTSRQLDIALGYRDRKGRLFKSKFYKEGFKTNKNGINYQTYKIARQESRRMQGLQQKEVFSEALDKGIKIRLKMIARLIQTSRSQSARMDGQMDGVPIGGGEFNKAYAGRFMYPDGNFYIFGTAPAKWSINDREFVVEVFDEPEAEPIHNNLNSFIKEQ
jgi:hypothetical protein